MDAPLIGITSYGINPEGRYTLPAEYVEAVRRAGGIPVLLPPGEPLVEQWLETVDAVILSGGVDVEPALYDGPGHDTITDVDRARDHTEVAIVHQCAETGQPLLAVCRGMQVLNVAFGGDLHAHIPDAFPDAIVHRIPFEGHEGRFTDLPHLITLDPGSQLAQVMGKVRFDAPSWHHQAIDEVGDGLVVVGHAPDGVIEAVEVPEHPFLLGVQWHPELAAATQPEHQRLFDALVRAATGDV